MSIVSLEVTLLFMLQCFPFPKEILQMAYCSVDASLTGVFLNMASIYMWGAAAGYYFFGRGSDLENFYLNKFPLGNSK